MQRKARYFTLISALTAAPAMAATSVVVVDQVGPGSIEVRQDASGNSVEVHQSIETYRSPETRKSAETKQPAESSKSVEKEKVRAPKPPVDYQKKVLTDPMITERGRARAIIGQQTGTTPALYPDDDAPKHNTNSIHIYQEGKNNKAVTRQDGESNVLNVEQKGEKNSLDRSQKGTYNRSRVVVNGEVVEDEETKE